jgi:hypothetical protein
MAAPEAISGSAGCLGASSLTLSHGTQVANLPARRWAFAATYVAHESLEAKRWKIASIEFARKSVESGSASKGQPTRWQVPPQAMSRRTRGRPREPTRSRSAGRERHSVAVLHFVESLGVRHWSISNAGKAGHAYDSLTSKLHSLVTTRLGGWEPARGAHRGLFRRGRVSTVN